MGVFVVAEFESFLKIEVAPFLGVSRPHFCTKFVLNARMVSSFAEDFGSLQPPNRKKSP